jgi:WG containing repeat
MRTRIFSVLLLFWSVVFLQFFAVAQENQPRLRPIQKDGKWGFIDKTGKVVIEPQFYWVEEFSEDLASFEIEDGKHGYIDETGKVVVEPVFDRAEDFSEGLAPVAKDFKWGYIDKSGKIVIPLQFQYAYRFKDGIAAVTIPLKESDGDANAFDITAFIDKTGKQILPPIKSVLNPRTSSGFLFIKQVFPVGEAPNPYILDKTGKVIIEAEDINLDGFREGLTPVKKNKKWGYIDTSGKFVIAPQFDEAKSFSEGLAAVKVGKKWGFINREGKLDIPAKFEINEIDSRNHSFSEGLALVYLNDRFVFIDRTGKTVFSFDYDSVERFSGGLAAVRIEKGENEKRGYIDKTGKFVWGPTEFKYKDLKAIVEKNREKQEREENESLAPLIDEEKRLDYRRLVANQPDFSADLTYFRSEMVSGSGGGERLTRKGNRYRRESQFWIFLGETGKPGVRLFPETKTYDDLQPAVDERLSYAGSFNPKTLADDADTTFTPLGKMTIDGHECIKVEVRRKGENFEKEKIFLYLAKDLKYLAITAKAQNLPFTIVQQLRNISLEVDDKLVQIPSDYKAVERDVWKKVENAKVKYRGKFSKEFGVFRSPTGELFVWLDTGDEFNSFISTFLVLPKQKIATIAFQGMLVTRSAKNVWETEESEAFADKGYSRPLSAEEAKSRGKPAQVTSKSIKFSSHYSNNDWIEIIF